MGAGDALKELHHTGAPGSIGGTPSSSSPESDFAAGYTRHKLGPQKGFDSARALSPRRRAARDAMALEVILGGGESLPPGSVTPIPGVSSAAASAVTAAGGKARGSHQPRVRPAKSEFESGLYKYKHGKVPELTRTAAALTSGVL